jgi:hypothetical protein
VSAPPWLVASLVVSLAIALAYQILSRRFGWRLLFYWAAVLVGFIGAELLAEGAGWSLLRVGDLRLLPDLAGSFLIVVALWALDV